MERLQFMIGIRYNMWWIVLWFIPWFVYNFATGKWWQATIQLFFAFVSVHWIVIFKETAPVQPIKKPIPDAVKNYLHERLKEEQRRTWH